MNHENYQFKPFTGLVISGPQGSGKTTLAQTIASQYGEFRQIETGPGCYFDREVHKALYSEAKTLIINGIPSQDELAVIKSMVTSRTMAVRRPYTETPISRPSPKIILCTEHADWLPDESRRFEVIQLSQRKSS
jgi:predicted P-loop ATPase